MTSAGNKRRGKRDVGSAEDKRNELNGRRVMVESGEWEGGVGKV
jgi:hypothetical protein